MDHILDLPPDPAFPPVIVPYIPGGSYDNQGFADFPSRKGWDLTKLYAGNLQGRSVLDAQRLLQNWLYFGTLSEFLDSTLDVDDFVCEVESRNASREGRRKGSGVSRPQLRITTKSLEKRLHRWMNRIKDLNLGTDGGKQRVEQISDSIDFVSKATRHPVLTELMGPELHLAVCVLGSTLDKARLGIKVFARPRLGLQSRGQKQHDLYHRFGASKLLVDRLRSSGWCPNQLMRMEKNSTPITLYYVSLLKRPNGFVNHDRCTRDLCMARWVDQSPYETKHVHVGRDCQQLTPDIEEIAKTIEKGGIQSFGIGYGEDGRSYEARIVSASPAYFGGVESAPYVAISCMWKDGFGNARASSLANCQIQKFADNVRPLLRDLSKQKIDKDAKVGFGNQLERISGLCSIEQNPMTINSTERKQRPWTLDEVTGGSISLFHEFCAHVAPSWQQ